MQKHFLSLEIFFRLLQTLILKQIYRNKLKFQPQTFDKNMLCLLTSKHRFPFSSQSAFPLLPTYLQSENASLIHLNLSFFFTSLNLLPKHEIAFYRHIIWITIYMITVNSKIKRSPLRFFPVFFMCMNYCTLWKYEMKIMNKLPLQKD